MSCDEDVISLQLAFNTAKHKSTNAIPLRLLPFQAGLPFSINTGLMNYFPVFVRELAFVCCRQKFTVICFINTRLWHRCTKGSSLTLSTQATWVFCRNHPLSDTLRKVPAKLSFHRHRPLQVASFITLVMSKLVDPTTSNFVMWANFYRWNLSVARKYQGCYICLFCTCLWPSYLKCIWPFPVFY
jgi:hypothetical protein